MFISLALSRRLCVVSIFFVALFVRLSGNMKILVDDSPVSTKHSASVSGAAPDVAPVSKIPVLPRCLLCVFRAQCAATLLVGPMVDVTVMAKSALVCCCLSEFDLSSCSSTRQASGDQ